MSDYNEETARITKHLHDRGYVAINIDYGTVSRTNRKMMWEISAKKNGERVLIARDTSWYKTYTKAMKKLRG